MYAKKNSPLMCQIYMIYDKMFFVLDGVKVVCNFAMENTTDRKISMTIKGLDVEVIKQTGYFFTNPLFGYNQKNKESKIQHLINRDGYVCSIEVKRFFI